jgi:hypothetical protein
VADSVVAEKKDIVIGVADGRGWKQLSAWALSLLESGFAGPCVVIVYDGDSDKDLVVGMLQSIGFHVVVLPRRGDLVSDRFADISEVLGLMTRFLRYAIVTDIADSYFQSDPTIWLEGNLTKPFLGVSEAIPYRDESWNRNDLRSGFPAHADRMLSNTVCNVGILAGEAPTVADLCLAISMIARTADAAVADQSAYNMLLGMEPYRSTVQIVGPADGFACQAGASANLRRSQEFPTQRPESELTFDADGVKAASGELFPVVYQVPHRQTVLLHILASNRTAASRRE